MRYLGIDFGLKRIGLAISDESNKIAFGLNTLENKGLNDLRINIERLVKRYNIGKIVIGFPNNMNGTPGYLSKELSKVVETLGTIPGIEVITWDERLTSVEGERIAREMGKKDRKLIDRIAATLILQSYLDFINRDTDSPSSL
ncbi:MAG: Holliday junction resolvase RuvX [bacterium]|nr:Holliday junction resolvase RuvX [bacterium]